MFIRKSAFTLLFVFFSVANILSQNTGLDAIDVADMKEHLTFLASDELQGRTFGTEVDGLNMAANYIAENAKQIGLKPVVPNYFQKVEIRATRPDLDDFVEVKGQNGKSIYRSGSVIDLTGMVGTNTRQNVPVVLLGFGELSSDISLEGKVVVVSQGNSEDFEKDIFHWNNQLERRKINSLSKKNPKAILIVTNPNDKEEKVFQQISVWFNRERYSLIYAEKEEIPVLIVLPKIADKLLGGKGKYKKYLAKVARNSASVFEPENRTVTLRTGKVSQLLETKNVIGVVEGSDPVLKDECVVFMAHYDHLGVNDEGDVYNGADDNGSGTVAIMEVAKAFATLKEKPKRSIVFLWVTSEELGMLGSGFYADHPVFPMEKTAVCFNLDMVGRVYEERDTVWNSSPKKVKDFDGLFTLSNDVWPELSDLNQQICKELQLVPDTTLPAMFLRSSDHYNFHKNGVPIMNYATGYHADYHKVGDEVDRINFQKMKRVAELCFHMGMAVANEENIERKSANQ